jgi:hypothetical protein
VRPTIAISALVACIFGVPANAAEEASCLFVGWASGGPIPVRGAPSPEAPPIAILPAPVRVSDGEIAVAVTVTGWREGWFRIAEAGFSDEVPHVDGPRAVDLHGGGWVQASAVTTTLATIELRAEPYSAAPLSARLAGFRRLPGGVYVLFGPEGVELRRIASCRGAWVEVVTEMGRGWTDRTCARQRSACD